MTEPTPSPEIDELLAYRGWVRRLCRQLVRSEVEAEDVEQETWRRALESPPRHRGNLKAWLATVARSAAMQRGRQAGASRAGEESLRQNMQADAEAEHAGADRRDGPDATAEQRETFALLHRLLIDLEAPYGEVVFLRYVQGLPPRRIAKRLDLPVATVKTRLNRGLEILRRRTRTQLGADWRNRCMVFVPSLPSVAATTLTTTIAMSNPSKLILAAAILILAIPVYSVLENDRGIDEVKESTEAGVSAAKPLMDPVADALVADLPPESDAPRVEQALPAPGGPPLKIVVKDRLTRKPVAGAEVFVLDPEHPQVDTERFVLENRQYWRTEYLSRTFGTRFVSNALGEVEVPGVYDLSGTKICGSTDTKYDFQYLGDLKGLDTVHLELLLRDRMNRTVEVVDATGAPVVGLEVAWVMAGVDGWNENSFMSPRTDAQGRAHFLNMQVRASSFEGSSLRHAFSARMGSLHPVRQEFDLFEVNPPPIRLQLPASVTLKVQADEEIRKSLVDGTQIVLRAIPDGETRQSFFDSGTRWEVRAGAEFFDGEAIFPAVEPGFQGYLAFRTNEFSDVACQRIEIAADAEGVQVATLHLPSVSELIEFVVVNQEGESLDAIRWSLTVRELGDNPSADRIIHTWPGIPWSRKVGEDQRYVRDAQHDRDYLVDAVSAADPSDRQFSRLRFDAALLTPEERVVLVEIHDNLVVSGRVVDQARDPVAGARISLSGSSFPHPKSGETLRQYIGATTNERGEFRIRGDRLKTSRLVVIGPDRVQSDFQFVPGVADQEFQVVISPQLKGSIFTDSGIPPVALHARLDPLHEVKQVGTFRITSTTGAFESRSISPGQFQFVVEDSLKQEVYRSEVLDLQAGIVEPESLNPLDLRGKLHAHTLHVLGPDGEEVPRFTLRDIDRGGQRDRVRSGEILVSTAESMRLVVDVPGFATSAPFTLSGEATVQLDGPVAVKVELPAGVSLQNEEFSWVIHFETTSAHDPSWKIERAEYLDLDGQVFSLPASGKWAVKLRAYEHRERGRSLVWDDWIRFQLPVDAFGGEGLSVVVPEGVSEWSFLLPIKQETLDKVRRD